MLEWRGMIKVRLAKFGRKNAPSYRVVVANARDKRNGRFLDILGHFNPSDNTKPELDKQKYEEWLKKGAQPTQAVQEIVEGTYKHIPYVRTAAETEKKERVDTEEEPKDHEKEEATAEDTSPKEAPETPNDEGKGE